jgi:hypothetical protein
MTDTPDGHGSAAAREVDATESVARTTKTQTTAASYTTTDHEVIKAWAAARKARPAAVERTHSGDDAGILRLEFPRGEGATPEELDAIEWKAFFRTFDDRGLRFLYQEQTSDGEISRFNKFLGPDDLE